MAVFSLEQLTNLRNAGVPDNIIILAQQAQSPFYTNYETTAASGPTGTNTFGKKNVSDGSIMEGDKIYALQNQSDTKVMKLVNAIKQYGQQHTSNANFSNKDSKTASITFAEYASAIANTNANTWYVQKGSPLPSYTASVANKRETYTANRKAVTSFANGMNSNVLNDYGYNEKRNKLIKQISAVDQSKLNNGREAVLALEPVFNAIFGNNGIKDSSAIAQLNRMLNTVANNVSRDQSPNKAYTAAFFKTALDTVYILDWLRQSYPDSQINEMAGNTTTSTVNSSINPEEEAKKFLNINQ